MGRLREEERLRRIRESGCADCIRLQARCYECHKKAVRDRYWADPERSRQANRERDRTPRRRRQLKASLQRQRVANPERFNARSRKWIADNPEKRAAHVAVGNAIRSGKLVKGPCEGCGRPPSRKVHAHHDDYSKPLDVRWLCTTCHGAEHRGENEAKRAEDPTFQASGPRHKSGPGGPTT